MYTKNKIIIFTAIILFFGCLQRPVKYVQSGDNVLVAYKIRGNDEIRIDESFLHNDWEKISDNEYIRFCVGNKEIISGWDSAIIGCRTDSLYTIKVPYSQAYDTIPVYHDIPAKSDLYIQFKIIDILQ